MDERNNQQVIDSLFREIQAGDMRGFRDHYESYREPYISFARRYTDDEELIADSYQDAFVALYENVMEQKITELKSSLKTYVFSIAKYSLFAKLRGQGKVLVVDDIEPHLAETVQVHVRQDEDPRMDQDESSSQ